MDLIFYKYAATPDRVNKAPFLTEIGTVSNVMLKADTNLMSPTFVLKTNPTAYNANYMLNTFTGRYYYINNITAMSGGRIAIDGKIDVLYTYKEEILNSSSWVECSAGVSDEVDDYKMLHNDFPFRADMDVLGCDFKGGFSPFSAGTGPGFLLVIK